MSCTRPLLGLPIESSINVETGKPRYKVIKYGEKEDTYRYIKEHPECVIIPCGHCIDCRLAYSKRWADRMMLELQTQKKAIFLTLTYDNNHLPVSEYESSVYSEQAYFPWCKNVLLCGNTVLKPKYGTLVKRDLQLFVKRLRKEYGDLKLRFYASGEYGELYHRPHYHMILYGIGVEDFKICENSKLCRHPENRCSYKRLVECSHENVALQCGKNELGYVYFTSPKIERIWSKGHVYFSDVSWNTCAYVARYVTKKLNGSASIDYDVRNCIPEFSVMSRKPGIGRQYLDEHPECLDYKEINISTPDGGRKIEIPSYYLRVAEDQEKAERIKETRKMCASEKLNMVMKETDLKFEDYNVILENKKLDSVKRLYRNKVE